MTTAKKTAKKPVDCSLIRVMALESGMRASTALRRAMLDADPFKRFLDVPREAVETYDTTIAELTKKVKG